MKNLGLKIEDRKPQDWVVGEFTPLLGGDTNPSGQWDNYLPVVELQNNGGFDRMACVSYALLNVIEVLHLHIARTEANFSDRFLAKISNTTHSGNYLGTVFDAARKNGLIREQDYPDVLTNWDDYYKPLTQTLKDKASDLLVEWSMCREWILPQRRDDIIASLRQTPLQVTVAYAGGSGILNPVGNYNHSVMVYGYDKGKYWKIFDHYENVRKKYAWDYRFGSILKPTLKNKVIPMKIKQNYIYQLVQGIGGFALGLDDRLIIDDTDKIMASFIMRNNGDIKGKTIPLTQEMWDSVPHYNLKGEKI